MFGNQAKPLQVLLAFSMASIFVVQVEAQTIKDEQIREGDRLVRLIDSGLSDVWNHHHQRPAEPAEDHVLLRRVTLDLVGRVPTEAEVRLYLADSSAGKYAQAVERLLRSAEFHRYLAVQLRRTWLPQLETQEFAHLITDYQHWLRRSLASNVSYDQLVYQQLTAPIHDHLIASNPLDEQSGSPIFLTVADMDPAKLAANSMRAFLGLNLDCAQCHDHPFSRWSRDQFWQSAAFFSRQYRVTTNDPETVNWCVQVEGTERVVDAAFLDQTSATLDPQRNVFSEGRRAFASWTVDPDNPYFAENAVNRIWSMLLGRPLVSPIDDLTEIDRATLGPLLKQLSKAFKNGNYQLVPLIRAIVLSRPYRLKTVEPTADYFAGRPPRMIGSTQLVNSLRTASGLLLDLDEIQRSSFAQEFVSDEPSESKRSTVQALMMMNGDLVKQVSDPKTSPLVQTLVSAPYLNRDDKIDSLFLRTLSRFPTAEERSLAVEFIATEESRSANIGQAYADLFWTLVNTAEFHVVQ